MVYDAVIVGGGLAGSLSATLLTRKGYRTALVDKHERHPAEFRAELIFGEQVRALERLGLLDGLVRGARFVNHAIVGRRGRHLESARAPHYFLSYERMVGNARASIPPNCDTIIDEVVNIESDFAKQRVQLAGGSNIETRLVVIATGLSNSLKHTLRFSCDSIRDRHSLAIGFCIAGSKLSGRMLVYYGEKASDRVDYISVFPWGDRLRANLFLFRDARDSWVQEFRSRPLDSLSRVMPRVTNFLGPFEIEEGIQVRTNHLRRAANHFRDGIVLVGDAFQTSCPAAGNGVSRLLTDVDRLCNVHFPRWASENSFSRSSVMGFYGDPIKVASDDKAIRAAEYRRNVSTETGLSWALHREAAAFYRGLRSFRPSLRRQGGGRNHPCGSAAVAAPMASEAGQNGYQGGVGAVTEGRATP